MGQVVIALAWGVGMNKQLADRLTGENGFIFSQDESATGLTFAELPVTGERYDCLAYPFAVSRSPDAGEAELDDESVCLTNVEEHFKVPLARAKKWWAKLVKHFHKYHVIELPQPCVIITSIERG